MYIKVDDVSKTFHQKNEALQVLSHISLEIKEGEFLCLLDPSGRIRCISFSVPAYRHIHSARSHFF